jgi:AraC-like DNA-binding protein
LDALQKINTSHGTVRINVLARELNISQDPFEKRFRRMVGTSPKQYSSIVRLKNVIASYRQNKNLTAAAYDAGYFDQAHFIKDFKSFTGQTPLNFFKSSSYW